MEQSQTPEIDDALQWLQTAVINDPLQGLQTPGIDDPLQWFQTPEINDPPQWVHTLGINDPLPWGYRLATTQDFENKPGLPGNVKDFLMWQVMSGRRGDIRNDGSQKVAIYDPNSPPRTLQLFPSSDSVPQGHRLATAQDVQANPEALRAAMPGWEVAILANGSVKGASYGCKIRH